MINQIKLTRQEKQDISWALSMWANYIETGDVVLSAKDAENMGKKVNALGVEQMKKVVELRELVDKVLRLPTEHN